MYQSLYRKYRPKSFEEVVGQTVIIKTLENSIKNNKLSHAYLFTGPRGTGKTSIAKILAKTINCTNLKNLTPCDECISCTQINNKQSVDIIEIDAASNNGVDEIREINNKVNLVPSVGKYKVYIIDEVHMLTIGAFNALLKTLEEPPSHIIFILATTEPHKIPATILSRCQRFDFKKINQNEIVNRLKIVVETEKIKIEEEAVNELAILSDGGMRDALSMLDQVSAYSDGTITIKDIHEINGTITNNEINNFLLNLIYNKTKEALNKIDEFDIKGKDFIKLTEEIILFLRNILLVKIINEESIYDEFNKVISHDTIMNYIKKFNNILPEMKNSSHPKIIFELLIIELLESKNNEFIKNGIIEETKKNSILKIQKEEKKIENQINLTIKNNTNIDKLKKIRINNTLCSLDKNQAIKIKEKINKLSNSLILDEFAVNYSMILEGKLTAFGNNTLIFVYDSKRISDEFNNNINEIESMLKKYLNEEHKVISTYQEDWDKIKKDYAINKNNYSYIEEPDDLLPKQINNNSIEEMFDSIIEYS